MASASGILTTKPRDTLIRDGIDCFWFSLAVTFRLITQPQSPKQIVWCHSCLSRNQSWGGWQSAWIYSWICTHSHDGIADAECRNMFMNMQMIASHEVYYGCVCEYVSAVCYLFLVIASTLKKAVRNTDNWSKWRNKSQGFQHRRGPTKVLK